VVASAPGHVEAVRGLILDALTEGELEQLGDIARRILTRLDETAADTRSAFAS
jgi:hypothetical protein